MHGIEVLPLVFKGQGIQRGDVADSRKGCDAGHQHFGDGVGFSYFDHSDSPIMQLLRSSESRPLRRSAVTEGEPGSAVHPFLR